MGQKVLSFSPIQHFLYFTQAMENFIRSCISFIENLNERVGQTTAWITTILMLLVVGDVGMRYLFDTTAAWVMELEWHLFALIFILGAGYAFKHDRHVRVDLFYEEFSIRDQAWVNLLGGILFLIPWCLLMIYVSFQYAWGSFLIGEGSPNPGGLPYRFLIKGSITIGMVLLFLQALASVGKSLLILGEKESET